MSYPVDQTLNYLIKNAPQDWLKSVMHTDSIEQLVIKLEDTTDTDHKKIIQARIDRINFLSA